LLEYVANGFGNGHLTGITSWLTYSANAIVTAMVAVSFGSYASALFTDEDKVWAKIFAGLIIILMTAVNMVGSTLVARAQTVIVYIVLSILVLFALVTIFNMHPSLLAPSGYPPLNDIISSVALTSSPSSASASSPSRQKTLSSLRASCPGPCSSRSGSRP